MADPTNSLESHPEYEDLPEAIKQYFSPKEYQWLTDKGRKLVHDELTMPESPED